MVSASVLPSKLALLSSFSKFRVGETSTTNLLSVFPVHNSARARRWWWLVVEIGSFPQFLLTHIQTLIKLCGFYLLYRSRMYSLISTFVLILLLCVCSVNSLVSETLWPYGLCSMPTSLSMGFPRQEYWSRLPIPPPVDLPNLGTECMSLVLPTCVSYMYISYIPAFATLADFFFFFFFTTELPRKSLSSYFMPLFFLTWTITMKINWLLQFSQ